jgi:hypothetical protein
VSTAIEALALRAGNYIWGVPWTSFTKDSSADVYGKAGYYIYLDAEIRKVMAFADKVDWTWKVMNSPQSEQALAAWYGVKTGILSRDAFISAALQSNRASLAGYEAPPFELEILRAFFSQMMALAMRGFAIHRGLLMQHGGIEARVIVENADAIHTLCQGLSLLYRLGVMNPILKRGANLGSAAGDAAAVRVGTITPVIATIIAIGAIAALSVMAWFLLKQNTIISQWQLANKICNEAMEDPTPAKLEACAKAQNYINDTTNTLKGGGSPFSGAMTTFATIAGVGLAIYLLAPRLTEAWQKRNA